jgi:hypothetical protein
MAAKRIKRQLPVKLTDDEKLQLASEMGKESQQHAEARERKKEVVAQLTAEVEMHRNQVERIGNLIANGYEYRTVNCEQEIDLVMARVKIIRLDTGEVIEDRNARPEELQAEMPFDD